MKHLRQLPPGTRNALTALLILAALYPALISLALHHTAAIGLTAATLLAFRIHPASTHKGLTLLRIPHAIASLITGHKTAPPTPEPTYKHAPAGPQVPVTNPTR